MSGEAEWHESSEFSDLPPGVPIGLLIDGRRYISGRVLQEASPQVYEYLLPFLISENYWVRAYTDEQGLGYFCWVDLLELCDINLKKPHE